MRANREPYYWATWLVFLTAAALVSRSYIPIDETRYLSVAWEMWQRGDFLVPYKNGEPYSHKPPLLFWLMHLGWLVGGVNEWWPRLISPLLVFASLFLLRRLASDLWPDHAEPARLAPWILMGSLLWSLFSQTIMFDLLMSFFTLLGILALVRATRGRPFAWRLFALAAGLGLLAKGPAILLHLLPAALLAPWWSDRGAPSWRRWYARLGLAVLGAIALALLWAVPAGLAGGAEYRQAIFWGQTANRMVESFAHQRPIWWYLPLLPLLLFPWLAWPALWQGRKAASRGDSGLRLALAWMLPAFAAFSLISGKQMHYLLPEFPAFALLASKWLAAPRPPTRPWLPALLLAALGTTFLLLPFFRPLYGSAGVLGQIPAWSGLVFVFLAIGALLQKDEPFRQVPRLSAMTMAATGAIHLLLVHPHSAAYDVRPIAEAIAQAQGQSRDVATFCKRYHAQFQFAGRLRHPLTELKGGRAARLWLRDHPDGVVVMYFPKEVDLKSFRTLFFQAYEGKQVALVEATQAWTMLDRCK
jgi:4-amino-4-deoxy-L-arabinose transferase-like glycosyltransferase